MHRRDALKMLPALAAAAALAHTHLFAQAGRRIPLGVQYGGPVIDPDGNKMKMEGFKQIGYDLIEPVNMRGFDPALFRKQAEEVGLRVRSIHITTADTSAPAPRGQGPAPAPGGQGGGRAGNQSVIWSNGRRIRHEGVVQQQDRTYTNNGIIAIVKAQAPVLRDLGVEYGVLGGSAISNFASVDTVKRLADTYNEAHRIVRAIGVNLCYHTHEVDFWPATANGATNFDLLVENTDPAIKYQVDLGWAAYGGADVVAVIRKHATRLVSLHMRDYKDNEVTTAGEGTFNWPAIFQATQGIGDPLCYVEGGDTLLAYTDLQKFGWGRA